MKHNMEQPTEEDRLHVEMIMQAADAAQAIVSADREAAPEEEEVEGQQNDGDSVDSVDPNASLNSRLSDKVLLDVPVAHSPSWHGSQASSLHVRALSAALEMQRPVSRVGSSRLPAAEDDSTQANVNPRQNPIMGLGSRSRPSSRGSRMESQQEDESSMFPVLQTDPVESWGFAQ